MARPTPEPAAPEPVAHDPGCGDDFGPQSLPFVEALRRVLEAAPPPAQSQRLALGDALGRVLACDVRARCDVPGHTNSAMDGYALRARDLPRAGAARFKVIGAAFAGRPFDGTLGAGECVRIMTGGVMPQGSDTVVIQEHADADGDGDASGPGARVAINAGHRAGQNVRRAGEDVAQGDVALTRGRRLSAADVGLLASLGVGEVEAFRRPKVLLFSTGDELRPVGTPLKAGEVYDSNRHTIACMLQRLGVEVADHGVVRDDREQLRAAFAEGARGHDAVITSGGVSVGEADFTKRTLDELGEVGFWKIAMKPGRPFAFGRIGDAVYFGLPGNPVSVMATFYVLVQPALRKMMGENDVAPLTLRARCTSALRKRPGRVEFQRGILSAGSSAGLPAVESTGAQGSGILSSMARANCFIFLPADAGEVAAGGEVTVLPFAGLV